MAPLSFSVAEKGIIQLQIEFLQNKIQAYFLR
jgi:hypothetical protein